MGNFQRKLLKNIANGFSLPKVTLVVEAKETYVVKYRGEMVCINKDSESYWVGSGNGSSGGSIKLSQTLEQKLEPVHGLFQNDDASIPTKFKEVMIFHELREREYADAGFEDAHERALLDERMYVLQYLSEEPVFNRPLLLDLLYLQFAEEYRKGRTAKESVESVRNSIYEETFGFVTCNMILKGNRGQRRKYFPLSYISLIPGEEDNIHGLLPIFPPSVEFRDKLEELILKGKILGSGEERGWEGRTLVENCKKIDENDIYRLRDLLKRADAVHSGAGKNMEEWREIRETSQDYMTADRLREGLHYYDQINRLSRIWNMGLPTLMKYLGHWLISDLADAWWRHITGDFKFTRIEGQFLYYERDKYKQIYHAPPHTCSIDRTGKISYG